MAELSAREEKVLGYLEEQIRINGYPPTVRDICAALGIKSTSTVHRALEKLAQSGLIEKRTNKRRAVKILGERSKVPVSELQSDVAEVPVVGRIAAGIPILAEQNVEDSFPIPVRFLGRGEDFMLRVRGDSMVEAGILDGDYILIRSQSTADNGDIVAAQIEGMETEATVKTFYKENGHIRLQPQNSAMSPIIVPDCRILGVVKGVFRYFD